MLILIDLELWRANISRYRRAVSAPLNLNSKSDFSVIKATFVASNIALDSSVNHKVK